MINFTTLLNEIDTLAKESNGHGLTKLRKQLDDLSCYAAAMEEAGKAGSKYDQKQMRDIADAAKKRLLQK